MAPMDATTDHAIQLAQLNAKLDLLLAQLGAMTERLREVELEVRQLREERAREEGKKAGSKAVITVLVTLLSFASGVLGAYWKGGPR
jgi:chromosome segregation ATPase